MSSLLTGFCFLSRFESAGHDEYITCVAYSHQEELLVSYNDELIYLFDKSMSMGSGPPKTTEDDEKPEDEAEGSHQEATKPQVYEGHRNHHTVKGVNFFGPNTEYVISGSDCGRMFIWRKKGGKLVALMKGDDTVVNCLEPHPHATILATSGIDDTIKVWAPISDRILELPQDADRVCLSAYYFSFSVSSISCFSFLFFFYSIHAFLWITVTFITFFREAL